MAWGPAVTGVGREEKEQNVASPASRARKTEVIDGRGCTSEFPDRGATRVGVGILINMGICLQQGFHSLTHASICVRQTESSQNSVY